MIINKILTFLVLMLINLSDYFWGWLLAFIIKELRKGMIFHMAEISISALYPKIQACVINRKNTKQGGYYLYIQFIIVGFK